MIVKVIRNKSGTKQKNLKKSEKKVSPAPNLVSFFQAKNLLEKIISQKSAQTVSKKAQSDTKEPSRPLRTSIGQ